VWLLVLCQIGAAGWDRARTQYLERDFAAAEAGLRTLLAADPANSRARILLARTLLELNRAAEAMAELDRALDEQPSPEVKFQIGQIARQLAEQRFADLQNRAPKSAALLELLGRQQELRGRFAEALEQYQAAAAMNPDRPGIHYWAGNALWRLRRLDEAKGALERELKTTPHHTMANLRLGQVLIAMDDAAGAVPHLEFAVKALPESVEARKDLGKAYLQTGRTAEARREWEAVAQQAPADDQIHYLLGNLYRGIGERDLAQREFARHREILDRRRALAERK
jgi:tetratricopeptide (TPR) repeat protein